MTTELIGYTDRLSVAPGEQIRFMVSTDLPSYNSSLVRLIHGDENPAGPGFKEERVVSAIDGRRAGRKQYARTGSNVTVADHSLLSQLTSFTLQAWIWPTTPLNGEEQGLLSKWSADGVGMCLAIGKQGALELWLGGAGAATRISTGHAMRAREWYFVAAAFDNETGRMHLIQTPASNWPSDLSSISVEKVVHARVACNNNCPLLMAATSLEPAPSARHTRRRDSSMARSTVLASSAGPLKPVKSSFCDRTTLQQNCPGPTLSPPGICRWILLQAR